MNYSKIIFEIEDELKHQFIIWLAKNQKTQKEVLTEYIKKIIEDNNDNG